MLTTRRRTRISVPSVAGAEAEARAESFAMQWWAKWGVRAVYGLGLVACLAFAISAGEEEAPGASFALAVMAPLFLGMLLYEILWRPTTITLTDEGVALEARLRAVLIPWRHLAKVYHRYANKRDYLVWENMVRRRLRTSWAITNRAQLLSELAHRAPHAEVEDP